LSADAGHCLIIISDNGKGLSNEVLDSQGSFHAPTAIPSHGLGLMPVQQIVKAHGSEVEMKNLPHAGCQIILRLPIQKHFYNFPISDFNSRFDKLLRIQLLPVV
jgi:K+-sensing histidine kinase KdpD